MKNYTRSWSLDRNCWVSRVILSSSSNSSKFSWLHCEGDIDPQLRERQQDEPYEVNILGNDIWVSFWWTVAVRLRDVSHFLFARPGENTDSNYRGMMLRRGRFCCQVHICFLSLLKFPLMCSLYHFQTFSWQMCWPPWPKYVTLPSSLCSASVISWVLCW